jgi:hypothetical protein|tara:strand:- start:1437 stop:1688 length:252 start_codon:yes stop_codon:yes gene_type:complete
MTDVEDEINSPSHYNEGSKETIDFIEDGMSTDEFGGYLKGNILKYVCRYRYKHREDPVKDLLKAHWYLVKLIDFTKKGSNYEK